MPRPSPPPCPACAHPRLHLVLDVEQDEFVDIQAWCCPACRRLWHHSRSTYPADPGERWRPTDWPELWRAWAELWPGHIPQEVEAFTDWCLNLDEPVSWSWGI